MVDLSVLKKGDTVTCRDGKELLVEDVSFKENVNDYPYPVRIVSGEVLYYTMGGKYLTDRNSDEDIIKITKKGHKMVNLADLEANDTVVWRDGRKFIVSKVILVKDSTWPYHLSFKDHKRECYLQDGSYMSNTAIRPKDIVDIIKGNTEMVDLSKAKVGDIAVLRDNSAGQIREINHTNSGTYPYYVNMGLRKQTHKVNGLWTVDKTSLEDIIKIIPNPLNKTLAEIIEDGVKVERPKPKKYLFKDETEPRELKIGDRLIHKSGAYYEAVEFADGSTRPHNSNNAWYFTLDNTGLMNSEDYLFVHETDKVIRFKDIAYGILKYKTPEQLVVNTHSGLEIWSRDKCEFI